MKKLLLFTFVLFSILFSQDIKELDVSITEVDRGVVAEPNSSKLLVKSKIPNLRFESNRGIKKVEQISTGEWKLTLYPGSQKFEIKAKNFISYSERITFKKQKVYECKVSEKTDNIYRNVESELYEVSFQFNVENVYCSFNDLASNPSIGKKVRFEVPEGEYTFHFKKDSYRPVSKTITVNSDNTFNITLKKDSNYRETYQSPGIAIITTSPDNAEIILDGQKYGYSPANIMGLLKGDHQLEIRMNKYHSDFSSFTINESEIKNLNVVLKPKFGYLNITSHPDNCEIYLNDVWVGKTPIRRMEYESGNYQLVAKKDIYHNFIQDDIVVTDGESKELEFDLKPAFGTLKIESSPEQGAEILINGKVVGTTPYQDVRFSSGGYTIELRKQYFQSIKDRITISDNKVTSRSFLLKSTVGTINVTSHGAELYLNDKLVTQKHNNIKVKPGSYKLRAEKDKHYSQEKTINISAGEIEKIVFDIIPKQGSISIAITPIENQKESEIFIDGVSYGKAPLIQKLLIGQYEIEVHINDNIYKKDVVIVANQDKASNFNINTMAPENQWTVTDIDGNIYKTVKIGNQVWMAENLKVTHYRNGNTIPNITDYVEWLNFALGAYCNYDNNKKYVAKYGRLYNWYAADDPRGLAPTGWHIPSDEEWKELEKYLGMSQIDIEGFNWRGTDEGNKLKSTSGWLSEFIGTNESGFSALPAGVRNYENDFMYVDTMAIFWSSTEINSDAAKNIAWHRLLGPNDIYRNEGSMVAGQSIRCIKD